MTDAERLPWAEQRALDDAASAPQLGYLLDRSPFYREKLAGTDAGGGLEQIAELPLTEKREVKATCTPENPFGAHLCVEPSELARIYSTSGTTGTPSYIPLTASDLDNWVTGSARSYGASGIAAATVCSRRTTQARSSPAQRSTHSRGSASRTSRSGPATASACCSRSSSCGPMRSC